MIIKIILFIVGIVIAISLINFILYVHPPRYASAAKPSDFGLRYEPVTLQTKDSIALAGWFVPNNKSQDVILVLHGYPFDKGNILPAVRFLAGNFSLMLVDFRYFGESAGAYTTVGHKEVMDVEAAVAYLKARNFKNIGIIGFSLGASAALLANPDVKAIVADSPYATLENMMRRIYSLFPGFLKEPFVALTRLYARILLGIDTKAVAPLATVDSIAARLLLVHGENDTQIPVENSVQLYEKADKSRTELWIIKNADHGSYLETAEYKQRITAFFKEAFRAQATA